MKKTTNKKQRRGNDNLKALAAFFGVTRTKDPAQADAQVAALLETLMRVGPDLPTAPPMTDAERGRLVATLCPHADFVVHETAAVLLRSPELYPDFPGVGATLSEGQRRCDRLQLLERFLQGVVQRCHEAQRIEQAKLLQRALEVAAHVDHAAALRQPQLDHEARRIPLALAARPLRQHRAYKTERRLATIARRTGERG